MPVVIVAILGIALVLYVRKRNSDEIRRIQEESAREAALYEQRLDEEAQEVERKCLGKPVEEQVRIREEFCARLEAEMKRCQSRSKEIEKHKKAVLQANNQEISSGAQRPLPIMPEAKEHGSEKMHADTSCASARRRDKSHGCGCTCEACLEGRHEDCLHDCELW